MPGLRSRFEPPQTDRRHILRPRLLEQTNQRWHAQVVVLVAGAGGGKTSLLAQTIAENRLAPVGTDHWLTCGPPHNDPNLFVRDLHMALGLPGSGSELSQLIEALYGLAGSHALVLDDLHRLEPEGATIRLLADLLRNGPPHLHLVLSSRHDPPLPLSRLEAQDLLVRIDPPDFAFDETEADKVADLLATGTEQVTAVGGWPALAALAANVGSDGPVRFLLEEILHALSDNDRDELAVLIAMGGATRTEMEGALKRPSRLNELATTVPLLHSRSDGTVVAHDLWNELAGSVAVGIDTDTVQVRAARVVAANGDYGRAFDLLIGSGDPDRAVSVVARAVTISAVAPSPSLLRSWRARLPPEMHSSPVMALIDGMIRYNEGDLGPETRDLLLAAIEGAKDAEMPEVEIAALIVGILVTQVRNESGLRIPLILRLGELATFGSPEAESATSMAEAGMCMLADDDEGVLTCLDRLSPEAMSPQWLALAHGMRSQALLMLGRDTEALEAAKAHGVIGVADEDAAVVLARFFAGVDAGLIDHLHRIDEFGISVVANEIIRCYADLISAWCGFETSSPPAGPAFGDADAPEMTLTLAQSHAIAKLTLGESEEAAATLSRGLEVAPEVLAWRCVRRFSGLSYVLAPAWRQRLVEEKLPDRRAEERQQGINLVRLREGAPVQSDDWADPARLLSALPLPMVIEVTLRRWDAADPEIDHLIDHLALVAPVATWDQIRDLVDSGAGAGADPALIDLAERFLAAVPAPFLEPVTLRLLGKTELVIGDQVVESPELAKRKRVRQLLAILGVERSIDRSRVLGMLWPDAVEASAAANLRTNLKHLLTAIEPGRRPGDAAFLIRKVGTRLELAGPAYVSTDIEVAERSISEAEALLAAGVPTEAMAHFEAAVDLWRGRPLDELADLAEYGPVVEHLTARLVGAAVQAAEIRLARSESDEASALAAKALSADPWAEGAHRVSIEAARERGDHTLARNLATECSKMLAELGVEPEAETAMVIRSLGHQDS